VTRHLGTGVAFPLATDRHGRVALIHDQEDVEQAIEIILGTIPGERPMRPDFGCAVQDFLFAAIDALTLGHVEHAVRVALARWETRIEVQSVEFDLSDMRDGVLRTSISYRLRATSTMHNLVHPFYVIPAEAQV
jgi:phage baseplate assembly protein W